MTTSAIIMLIVAIAVVWGGLIASILFLRSRPEVEGLAEPLDGDEDTARMHEVHGDRDL